METECLCMGTVSERLVRLSLLGAVFDFRREPSPFTDLNLIAATSPIELDVVAAW